MIRREDIIWELKKYLVIPGTDQHEFGLYMNKPLSDWDVFDEWERERVRSMQQNLGKSDILFDVGAEMGWLSVIYGQIVGPRNMVLIEPTAQFWPNIEALWHKNFDAEPLGTYRGLVSDTTTSKDISKEWPPEASGDLIEKLAYTNIFDDNGKTRQITLDDYIKQTGYVPNAITIDVEGAELKVLQGAADTLKYKKPKLWVSIHPDLMERDYKVHPDDVHEFLYKMGYKTGKHLATDHEMHYFFEADDK